MKRIEEIDKNFVIKNIVARENTQVFDVCDGKFLIHGVLPPADSESTFYRMPMDIASGINEGVSLLNTNCAGGRIRFKTNSSYIAVKAVMGNVCRAPHFSLTGTTGFDLYSGLEHITTFQPADDIDGEMFGEYDFGKSEFREYTLNLSLYSDVKRLYIILDKDAVLEEPTPYRNKKPVVFYGSSITQGGCASRPGNSYSAILSRRLNMDYINLGFSGSARGEKEAAEYIAGLDMCAFVFDYDHNAPSAEHLIETHESFFKIIRKAHPEMPIICMTEPYPCFPDYKERKNVIEKTVIHAREAGDKNVYFIDMTDYFEKAGILNEATVDRCHPNDLGFHFMAEAVEKILKKVL